MKVLHAVAWYPPFSMGGTEVYLSQLVNELRRLDVESVVAVPAEDGDVTDYEYEQTKVVRYPVNRQPNRLELLGDNPHDHFDEFIRILKEHKDAIYHQHSWTRGCGNFHLQAARSLGMRTMVTVHVPGNICLRGTMMKDGKKACTGEVSTRTCASCWLEGRGVPSVLASSIAAIPKTVAKQFRKLPGTMGSLLGAHEIAAGMMHAYKQMMVHADRVVVVSQWLHDALLVRGASKNKLFLSRHGIDSSWARMTHQEQESSGHKGGSMTGNKLRMLFLGRWDPLKGIDVAVRAMRRIPKSMEVELVIHATGGGAEAQDYEKSVRQLAIGDDRIFILPSIERIDLWDRMGCFDVLIVPSQSLETGPLVVLEALSRGLFVIGSDLGGIAEWVDKENGLLVSPKDVDAWVDAFRQCIVVNKREDRILCTPRSMRSMEDIAVEMRDLYYSVV